MKQEVLVKKNRILRTSPIGKRYQKRINNSSDNIIKATMVVLLLVSVYYIARVIVYKWEMFDIGFTSTMVRSLFRFDLVPREQKVLIMSLIMNTVLLGLVTTLVGFAVAFPLGLFAAKNISSQLISNGVKGFAAVIRAIPTIVWVLVFVAGYGLTATTAIIGMTFHTVSFFIKAFSEAFEEVDIQTIEALQATGASRIQIIFSAIVPSAYTKLISWSATRTEINFAVAVVIGPAVGVPNTIGTAINVFSRTGNYPSMFFSVFCVFFVALVFEFVVTRIKQNEIVSQ